jgi:hypothetical protein
MPKVVGGDEPVDCITVSHAKGYIRNSSALNLYVEDNDGTTYTPVYDDEDIIIDWEVALS